MFASDKEAEASVLGRSLEIAVVVAAIVTVPLLLDQELGIDPAVVLAADWIVWGVFLIEFVVMSAAVRGHLAYARSHWFDALVVVLTFPVLPDLFGVLRLSRLFRVLRLFVVAVRALRGLRAVFARPGLLYVAVISLFLLFLGAALITAIEPETVKGNVGNGLWWAIVTASTVGYGDISPSTLPGRVVAVFLMVCGVSFISTLSASVAAYFVECDDRDEREDLERQLVEVRRDLDDIKRLLQAKSGSEAEGDRTG